MKTSFLLLGLVLLLPAWSQTVPPANTTNAPAAEAVPPATEVGRLAQSNRDLLELLKKQQGVLEDIQYDRRLQNRQIQQLEERLTDTLQENGQLRADIAKLKAEAAHPVTPPSAPGATNLAPVHPAGPTPDNPPASYLPPVDDASGWHRLFTLSGTESKTTNPFQISTHRWRVVWHNQDKAGVAFKNTSALFINAFPKDDIIPQKVCSKLGSGGDSGDLVGPGTYFLKVEASGGSWELAVETAP